MANCLHDKGVTYVPEPFPEGGNAALARLLYPPDDLVEQYGYDWLRQGGPQPPPPNPANAGIQDGNPLSDACGELRFETLDKGAYTEALQVLYTAAEEIRAASLASATVLEATRQWSACMLANGYEFSTQLDAYNKAFEVGVESAEGRAIARSDFGCQRDSRLPAARESAVSLGTEQWIEAHPTAISDTRTLAEDLAGRARSFLGE